MLAVERLLAIGCMLAIGSERTSSRPHWVSDLERNPIVLGGLGLGSGLVLGLGFSVSV